MKKTNKVLCSLLTTFIFTSSSIPAFGASMSTNPLKSNIPYENSFNISEVSAKNSNDEIYQGVVSYVNEVYVNMDVAEKNKLIEERYKEKSSVKNISNNSASNVNEIDNVSEINEIDEAYNRVDQEERYIVSLINSYGKDTTLSNWKFNLEYLKNNYNDIKVTKNINLNYIDSYIQSYNIVLLNNAMPDKKVSNKTTASSSYKPSLAINSSLANGSGSAIDYATHYYQNYNTNYPDWTSAGGDCANFISQCLYAGGKTMVGTPGSASAANFSNWFSVGTSQNTSNVSSTWRGADAFRNYWQSNATSYKTFTAVDSSSWNYGYTGDAVSLLNSNGRAFHTLIIVGYSNPDFILAAHTSNTMTATLSSKVTSYGFVIYNMN